MKKSKILVAVLLVGLTIAAFGIYRYVRSPAYLKETVPEAISIATVANKQPVAIYPEVTKIPRATPKTPAKIPAKDPEVIPPIKPSPLPKELNLAMTFYSQAPFGDWNEPWQNACEEASLLLVANAYYDHKWTREQFRDQVLAIVDWQNKTFGYYKSTTTKQMAQILEDSLKLKNVIHTNPTFKDVQEILARGHLIVIPLAGKKLGNPFFKNGGPEYHALVIKGYKEGEKVITSDVGTKHGEDYVYSWKTLSDANHDYAKPIDSGAKMLIEVLPPSP